MSFAIGNFRSKMFLSIFANLSVLCIRYFNIGIKIIYTSSPSDHCYRGFNKIEYINIKNKKAAKCSGVKYAIGFVHRTFGPRAG